MQAALRSRVEQHPPERDELLAAHANPQGAPSLCREAEGEMIGRPMPKRTQPNESCAPIKGSRSIRKLLAQRVNSTKMATTQMPFKMR